MLFKQVSVFGVGGRARRYVRANSPEELVRLVSKLRQKKAKFYLLAGGSNIVGPDGEYPGTIVHFLAKQGLKYVGSNGPVEASAGLPLASLIKGSIKHGLAGLEALSGIPGTVGGALVGNAGAYGQCISDTLISVQIFDPNVGPATSNIRWIKKSACKFAYRESVFKRNPPAGGWLVLRARFKLKKSNKKELAQKSREIIKIRAKRYPPNLKCPGSFFKNVLVRDLSRLNLAKIDQTKIRDGKVPAGWLLAEAGALNRRVGGISVSNWHGNLIINNGRGTARDVKKLAAILKNLVRKKFGIKLEEEVRYVV